MAPLFSKTVPMRRAPRHWALPLCSVMTPRRAMTPKRHRRPVTLMNLARRMLAQSVSMTARSPQCDASP
jgi:hypothetical protein